MKEIERKWLVEKDLCPIFQYGIKSFALREWKVIQGYLNNSEDEYLIRVRQVKEYYNGQEGLESHYLELKSQGLLSRDEYRFFISKKEFENMLDLCDKSVSKTRYIWESALAQFEIDVYDDYDFITCEVEFKSEEEANEFKAPEWCTVDVTMDPHYKNVNLAK